MTTENKPKLKICHLADLHLGYRRYNKLTANGFNQREIDVNLAFRESVDRIINLKPDLTIIAGDIFHSVRPSNAVITFCFKQIRRLAEKTQSPVIVVAGNHDSPKRADSGSLIKLFAEIDDVYIADSNIEKLVFPELHTSITCVPHYSLVQGEKIDVRADDKYTYNILVLHGQVGNDWLSDFGGAEINLKDIVVGEWDYIALGHVHVYQEVTLNAAYSGSIEHTAKNIWAEADYNKGFLEIQLPECRKIFYSLTSPREILALPVMDVTSLDPEEVMKKLEESIKSVSGGIEGKIIRIELRNLSRATYAQLDHKKIRSWRAQALNLMLEFYPPEISSVNQRDSVKKKRPLNVELEEFCKEQKGFTSKPETITKMLLGYLDNLEVVNETNQSQT